MKYTFLGIIIVILIVPSAAQTPGRTNSDIRRVIASYQAALNDGKVTSLTQLFAEDGVAMLQGTPPHIGGVSLHKNYDELFRTLHFDLVFSIAEIVQVAPEWIFVRTSSQGKVNILANNNVVPSSGQELFLLEKRNGEWKIARYAASSTK